MRRKEKQREKQMQQMLAQLERIDPNKNEGLTDTQVQERIRVGAVNQATSPTFKTNKQIVMENVFTYFNLIFLVLAILLCVVNSYKNLTFLPVILANTGIAIYQEIHSKKILDQLSMLHAATVKVLRNGQEQKITIEELVLDDLVILKTGDQIPADGKIIDGNLQVNEALLTGEADEINKEIGDELMSGSFIVAGKAKVQLTRVGNESYIAKLTMQAKEMGTGEQSEMIASLDRIIKWVGIILL